MGRQSGFCKAGGWDAFCFELLVAEPEALAVVHQHLQRRRFAIAEDEDNAGKRIVLQSFLTEPCQAIDRGTNIIPLAVRTARRARH